MEDSPLLALVFCQPEPTALRIPEPDPLFARGAPFCFLDQRMLWEKVPTGPPIAQILAGSWEVTQNLLHVWPYLGKSVLKATLHSKRGGPLVFPPAAFGTFWGGGGGDRYLVLTGTHAPTSGSLRHCEVSQKFGPPPTAGMNSRCAFTAGFP